MKNTHKLKITLFNLAFLIIIIVTAITMHFFDYGVVRLILSLILCISGLCIFIVNLLAVVKRHQTLKNDSER